VVARRSGVVRNIEISRELEENVVGRFVVLGNGDVIDDRRANRIAGVLFLQYGSADEMVRKSTRMNELAGVEVVPRGLVLVEGRGPRGTQRRRHRGADHRSAFFLGHPVQVGNRLDERGGSRSQDNGYQYRKQLRFHQYDNH